MMCICESLHREREISKEISREMAGVSVRVVSGNRCVIGPREGSANFEKSPVRVTNIVFSISHIHIHLHIAMK